LRTRGAVAAQLEVGTGWPRTKDTEEGREMDDDGKEIALIFKHPDYRGDHALDTADVIRVPRTMTVAELLEIVKSYSGYGKAWIEVAPEISRY